MEMLSFKYTKDQADQPAIIDNDNTLTYREFFGRIKQVSGKLSANNICNGERIAVIPEVSSEFIILYWALLLAKAIPCLLSERETKEVNEKQISELGCRHVISDIKDWVAEESDNSICEELSFDQNQWASILYTSGSTGNPKACVHTISNYYFNALGAGERIALNSGDRWLLNLPLYHVAGLSILYRTIIANAVIIINQPDVSLNHQIHEHKITHVSVVPQQLQKLLNRKEPTKLSSLKAILCGGDRTDDALIDGALNHQLPLYLTYGLTEMSSQVATGIPKKLDDNGYVIKAEPLPYRNITVLNDNEVWVKGEALFNGYLVNDDLQLLLNEDGWFFTGDLGSIQSGYLQIKGRKDNMFISGGENIVPEEIEEHLLQIPNIQNAVVVPRKSDEYGSRPVAFIDKNSNSLSQKEIESHLTCVLAKFKIPDAFYQLPANTNKSIKIRRSELITLINEDEENLQVIE